MMKNETDREIQDNKLEMNRNDLSSLCNENRPQCQMMQIMMVTFMTHNNPVSNVAQNNQNNTAIQDHNSNDINLGIGNSEEPCDGNCEVIKHGVAIQKNMMEV